MADENIVTNIVANADFSNLIADVHKVTASLSKMQQQIAGANKNIANQIRAMNNAFSDTIKSTGQYSTHFVSLTSDVEKFGRNLDSGKLKLGQYFGTMQQHTRTSGGLIRDLAKQQVALQNAVLQPLGKNAQGLMQFNVQVPRGLDVIKNKTAIANQELQIMNKVIQQGAGQLINWGKNTQWAGRQLTVGLTVPLAAFGKASADAFRAADAELVRLTKVYGGLAATSSYELGKVRKEVSQTANELAKAYGLSFKDSIGLAADIAATGKTGKDLIGSLQQTSRLAVLGEVDRQEALKATLALQNAFKQNTQELTESIDFLNSVENQTSTSLADLIEAIPKAGPIFKGLGGDVKDLSLMLVAMKEGGINATEGANALKSGLASLINPTKVAVATFADFGISLNDIVNSNAGDVTGMILGVQSAIDKLDPLSKQRAIEQLFGKFQFARMNALFENLGKQGSQTLQVMDLMKASSEDLAGIAGRELSQVTESASGKYKRALEGLKADLATVGEGFLNIQTKFINIIDAVVKFAGNLPGPVKTILGFLGGLTAVVGPLLMLTGVLANFFGYIVKGAASLKMLFKGQSGWKLLTPEILAAQKAGSLMEQTFYSDAKAADVLRLAVGNLTDQFDILQAKVNSGSISVSPALSTIAGNVIQQGGPGGRVVNPNHPLVGAPYSRASTHMVARADLTEQQRLQQTMFGLVPGSGPVNQKIGTAPQIYMNDELPNVPGLTRVNGVSTGVVAGEAAKFHAMTATLGMQSKAEIASLRKTIAATGTVSKEFMGVFDDILPAVTAVTNNAARESAAIVAQLQSGAINVQQARAQIIELNLRIEQMIASTVSTQAGLMGRTINPTMVPMLDQPVVDATGKSNMRELFKKGKTKDLVNRVATALGVRTSGAGYNIETTRPRKFASGVVAVNKYAGGYLNIQARMAAAKMLRDFAKRSRMIGGTRTPNTRGTGSGATPISAGETGVGKTYGQIYKRNSSIYRDPEYQAYGITPTAQGEVLVHAMVPGFRKRTSSLTTHGGKSSPSIPKDRFDEFGIKTSSKADELIALPSQMVKNPQQFNDALKSGASASDFRPVSGDDMVGLLLFLKDQGVQPQRARIIASRAAEVLNKKILSHKGLINETTFGNLVNNASVRAISSGYRPSMTRVTNPMGDDMHSRNRGLFATPYAGGVTKLPGYGGGDTQPALLEKGESVVTATATRGNEGAISLMNAGYPVDKIMGFDKGVTAFGTAYQAQKDKGYFGSGMMKGKEGGGLGMGAQMGIMMGGGMAGQAIGGGAGTAVSLASSIIPWLPIQKMLPGIKTGITSFKAMGGAAGVAGKVIGLAMRAGPILAITLAITAAVKAFQIFKRETEQNRKEQILLNGITEKGAKEAGIKYSNLSNSIKSVNEQLALTKAKGLNAYAALNSSGVQGLTLSIQELRDKIKKAKTDQKELVEGFTNIDDQGDVAKQAKVTEMAINLKAQMVASGISAQEATNNVYAMISASDKADMAFSAISSKGFREIVDASTAADSMITKLAANMSTLSGEALGIAISQTTTALDKNFETIIQTQIKNKETVNEYKAMSEVIDQIVSKKGSEKTLTQDQINSLKKTHPELAKILNATDNTKTVYQKWRVLLSGIDVDLQNISATQLNALAQFDAAMNTALATQEKSGKGIVGLSQTKIAELQKKITAGGPAAQRAAQKTQDQIKAEMKLIDEKIKKINEEADARKKALQAKQSEQSLSIEIQKAQLEYQNKISAGDMEGAAQAQLKIKQLLGEQQSQKALDAIEADRAAREKELLDKREKLQKQSDKTSTNLANAQEGAAVASERVTKIDSYQNEYERLMKKQVEVDAMVAGKEKDKATEGLRGALGDLAKQISADAKGKDKVLADALKKIYGDKLINDKGESIAGKVMPSTHPKGVATYKEGAADAALKSDANALSAQTLAITGGKTNADIVNAINKTGLDKSSTNPTVVTKDETKYGKLVKDKQGLMSLSVDSRKKIIAENKLKEGDFFEYDGVKYKVKMGGNPWMPSAGGVRVTPGRALFGRTSSATPSGYMVGERGPEYFKPDVSGMVMPSYNAPDIYGNAARYNTTTGKSGGNNTFNVTMEFAEAPANARQLWQDFKQMAKSEGAKAGEKITFGGSN